MLCVYLKCTHIYYMGYLRLLLGYTGIYTFKYKYPCGGTGCWYMPCFRCTQLSELDYCVCIDHNVSRVPVARPGVWLYGMSDMLQPIIFITLIKKACVTAESMKL